MKISLCMIVKNEEKNLKKSLESINRYVDEIVIIDTGSNDKTKEIASSFTDKIYDFSWCDDFSKARNFSISKSTNDWILVLDADEIITKFNKNNIKKIIEKDSKIVGRIKRINPFDDGNDVKKYIERVNRLFNKKWFHYEGVIHEQIVMKSGYDYDTINIEIEVNHIGYLDEVIRAKNKLSRNINLLIDSIERTPNDPYLHYQLGKSYYKKKDYQRAYESFRKSIKLCKDFKFEYTQDLVESYGYTLLKCEKYNEAMELKKYKVYYANSPDYNFVMGLIYMNNGKFQEAVETFELCIGKNEGKIEGINSYQPNYNIGVIYEMLGLKEKALKYYRDCGNYNPAQNRIAEIMSTEKLKGKKSLKSSNMEQKNIKLKIQNLIENGNLEQAEFILNEALKIDSKDIELYSMKAVLEIIENRLEEAESTLLYAIKINENNFDILYNLGYLYEMKNEKKLAIKYYQKCSLFVKDPKIKLEINKRVKNMI